MNYPNLGNIPFLIRRLGEYSALQYEYEAPGLEDKLAEIEGKIAELVEELKALPVGESLARREPDDLEQILALRPDGPRVLKNLPEGDEMADRMNGALFGRLIGCILGVPVEGWPVENMEKYAAGIGMSFPPVNFWEDVTDPDKRRFPPSENYKNALRKDYRRPDMVAAEADDDITYTLLGLVILEKCGIHFSTEDVARVWKEILPFACTAEDVALRNINNGVPAEKAADIDNPYCLWIGADIRSDPWGYACAGCPEAAARMAYYDAYLTHRRGGIYGEMFFSAVIAAAFACDDPLEAVRIGLTEIPADCALRRDIDWALSAAPSLTDWRQARKLVDERFGSMSHVHTYNNACLVVFALSLGKKDFTKTLSEVVAMGMDNDCTGATTGSILGAVIGKRNIPEYWYKNFNDTVHTYITGYSSFSITDAADRFIAQNKKVLASL